MNLFKVSVLTLSIGLLAACSSGGGSGDSDASTSTANRESVVSSINTLDKDTMKSIDLVPERYREQVKEAKRIRFPDGTILDLADYPIGIIQEKTNSRTAKGINLPYSVIGAWLPNNVKVDKEGRVIDPRVIEDDLDAFGLYTRRDQIPTSGVAQYNGYSLGAVTSGKLQLNVDFADKTVDGKLYDRKFDSNGKRLSDIVLNKGVITEVSTGEEDIVAFTGMATYKGEVGAYVGAFMGPNAEEVIGVVIDSENQETYESFAGQRK
ncbi:factor H binding protein domain-containing protein [Avibacterium volantium]|uniref:factor H binding protein domain-containing protein n=1 Tax=Avibacterium TaxID=292486 RepID=UPI0039FCF7F0